MTVIFEDGFETGDFSLWTETRVGTGDTATVVSTDPHHGTKHAKFSVDGVITEWSCAVKMIGGSYTVVYARAYFKFKATLPDTTDDYERPISLKKSDSDVATVYLQRKNDGKNYLYLRHVHAGGTDWIWGTTEILADTWYCMEVYAKVNDAVNGEAKVWLNGNLEIQNTGKNTTNQTTINQVFVGNGYQADARANDVYVDCVKVADVYIGLEVVVTMGKFQYFTEPPTTGFNKLRYQTEPPTTGWNKLLYEGE